MHTDKQLRGIRLKDAMEKRRLDQALNKKEFAVVAGISYSAARAWFKSPGFPTVRGMVFWQDFVNWRSARNCLNGLPLLGSEEIPKAPTPSPAESLPARAARILIESASQ